MAQPITSKLAVVAECMDDFLRLENEALLNSVLEQARVVRALEEERTLLIRNVNVAVSRINALEADLESSLDHNERLVEQVYNLETSILECDHHPGREILFTIPPPVARRLQFEHVDLTTDEELEDEV